METFINWLIEDGYWGMFISAFVAGSILPFSSEAVMLALLALGLDPIVLCVSATIGNWAGTMINYYIGTLGKTEWIERYLRIKHNKIEQAQRFMKGRGAVMGIFTFLPVIGSAISVVLGLMRADLVLTSVSIFIGKALRYIALVLFSNLFVYLT